GHAATRVPVPTDAQVVRSDEPGQALADGHRAVFVEGAVVAEGVKIELERLGLHKPAVRYVVDDEMGKVGLASYRAQRGELRRREAGGIGRVRMWVGHAIKHRLVWALRQHCLLAE